MKKSSKKFFVPIITLLFFALTLTACSGGSGTSRFTVTFNSDGGTAVASQTLLAGATASMPAEPVKYGAPLPEEAGLYPGVLGYYDFIEWRYSGVPFDFDTPILANITLTAHWTAPINPGRIELAINDIDGAIVHVRNNADAGEFTLLISEDINTSSNFFNIANMRLTIIGIGGERTIQIVDQTPGSMFTIDAENTSLTLGNNITLMRQTDAVVPLIGIQNGNLTLRDGSKITGINMVSYTFFSVILVDGENASFSMSGGTITGNHVYGMSQLGGLELQKVYSSGAVHIRGGAAFTMSGGSITGNTRFGVNAQDPEAEAMDLLIGSSSESRFSHTGGTIGSHSFIPD